MTKKILPPTAIPAVALPGGNALAAPKGKVQFSSAAYAAAENSGSTTISVIRPRNGHSSARLNQRVSVDFTTTDGTGKAGTDYQASSGTLNFPDQGTDPVASIIQPVNVALAHNPASSPPRHAQAVRALVLKAKTSSLTLQPGKATTVKVKFANKTLKAITKALRARKSLVATVVVTSKDSASRSTRKTLRITIRR